MQEPQRLNLYNVVQKTLIQANRRTYIHRLIYIIKKSEAAQDIFQILEKIITSPTEDKWDEPLAGLALVSNKFIFNCLEGTESMLEKHLIILKQQLQIEHLSPTLRILIFIPHINRRVFISWKRVDVTPPKLVDESIRGDTLEHQQKLIRICVTKLHRIMEYLSNQSAGEYRKAVGAISENCQQHLPEDTLLESLLNSSLVLTLEEFLHYQTSVPQENIYHERVWPCPPDFVPYNVICLEPCSEESAIEKEIKF